MTALQHDAVPATKTTTGTETWPVRLVLALAGGLALRGVLSLTPLWWLAWLAPLPLLVAVARAGRREAAILATLAGCIGASVNLDYLRIVMGLPTALGVVLLQALAWTLVLGMSRRVMQTGAMLPSLLAYPLLWTAFDTISAHWLPDGNWGSLAYSQANYLPAVQVLALGGTPLLVFLVSLPPSALALLLLRGPAAWKGVLFAVAVAAASLAYGMHRIDGPPSAGALVGLASIDDPIGPLVTPVYANAIWSRYETLIDGLARAGAQIVVLPEKIAMLAPGRSAAPEQARLARAAASGKVWLVAGIGTEDGAGRHNLAWLFSPSGQLVQTYRKQHMAPGEREFIAGHALALQDVAGERLGLAVCKDMHFAQLGRDYAGRITQAMAVPAWDFRLDAQYAARLSALRGIESGFAMVRVAREGLLTVTDAYGRIAAETASAPLPGATLLARLPEGTPVPTLYARIGDTFGYLALAACVPLLWQTRRRARATPRFPTQ